MGGKGGGQACKAQGEGQRAKDCVACRNQGRDLRTSHVPANPPPRPAFFSFPGSARSSAAGGLGSGGEADRPCLQLLAPGMARASRDGGSNKLLSIDQSIARSPPARPFVLCGDRCHQLFKRCRRALLAANRVQARPVEGCDGWFGSGLPFHNAKGHPSIHPACTQHAPCLPCALVATTQASFQQPWASSGTCRLC